jgi:hypothetical protein
LNTPGIRPPRALRAGRIAALGVNRISGTQHYTVVPECTCAPFGTMMMPLRM